MATLSIPKDYAAKRVLQKSHLDSIVTAIETFLNTTQLDYENIQISNTLNNLTSTYADNLLSPGGWADLTTETLSSTHALTTTAIKYNTLTLPSSGKYLITGMAKIYSTGETDSSSGGDGELSITCNLVYGTSDTVIQEGNHEAGCITGGGAGSVQFENQDCISYLGIITASTGDTISFLANYSDTDIDVASASILQDSVIQAFRLRSSA